MKNEPDPTLAEVVEFMRSRFNAIDARLDSIDDRLANHSESIAWLKMNVGMLSQAIAGVSTGVEHCKFQLNQWAARLDQLETTSARLSEAVNLSDEPSS